MKLTVISRAVYPEALRLAVILKTAFTYLYVCGVKLGFKIFFKRRRVTVTARVFGGTGRFVPALIFPGCFSAFTVLAPVRLIRAVSRFGNILLRRVTGNLRFC